MKTSRHYKFSDATLAQIAALAETRNGNATAVIEIAVDRMYQQEGSAPMPGMNYEAEPQEFDARMLALANAVHDEVCGCDNKRCSVTGEIYEWLSEGDGGDGRALADLVAEWREYDSAEEAAE